MTRRFLVVLVFALLAPSSAMGQEGKRTELTLQVVALATAPTWRVTAVDPSGEMTLKFEGFDDATMAAVEGYFLIVPVAGGKSLARVLVTDVDTKGATVKTSPEAAKAFPPGSGVHLVRPFPATTKQLKSIPELISISVGNLAVNDARFAARDAATRTRSINNMKQIGLAMHNYMAANDHLPPAIVRGPDGKPWHSWRILILPYIEGGQVAYNAYDFSQPWDSEKNLKILDQMPSIYRDPVYLNDKGHFTNFAVVVGEETPFPPSGMTMKKGEGLVLDPKQKGKITVADIADGTSNTIAAVPVSPDRKIPWTKPEDIEYKLDRRVGRPPGELFPAIGEPGGIAAPYESNGEKVAPILMLDGSVKLLAAKAHKAIVSALITRSNGEIVADDVFAGGPANVPARPAATTLTIVVEGGKATATIR